MGLNGHEFPEHNVPSKLIKQTHSKAMLLENFRTEETKKSYKLPEKKIGLYTKDHENTFSNMQEVKKLCPRHPFTGNYWKNRHYQNEKLNEERPAIENRKSTG